MKLKLVAVATCLFAIASAADTPAQVKVAIGNQMSAYIAALKARDVKKVESVIRANFATDFKDIGPTGQVKNLQQTIDTMRMNVSALKSVKAASLTIDRVKVDGNKATTTEVFHLDAVLQIPGETNKTHTLRVDSSWTGTYVKKNGRWWCTVSKTINENVLLDGKKPG